MPDNTGYDKCGTGTYVADPKPFRVINAGGSATFAGMREDSVVTIADIFLRGYRHPREESTGRS